MVLAKRLLLISAYVAGSPSLWPQATLTHADPSSAQGTALVKFVTEPPGSSISIEGAQIEGRTPITVNLAPGSFTVNFLPSQEGYGSFTALYSWHAGESKRIAVQLPKTYGDLCLVTSYQWTNLQLDRRPSSIRASSCERIQAGSHTILAFEGRHLAMAKFHLREGTRVSLKLTWRTISPDPDSFAMIQATKTHVGSPAYGDFNPPKSVDLRSFWIQRNETTVREYRQCVQAGKCSLPAPGENCNWNVAGRDEHPVNCVSALQALQYAEWFSAKDNFAYRLPTDAEWEHVATAEGKHRYPWGTDSAAGRCNTCDRSCPWQWRNTSVDDGWPLTAPVGVFKLCAGSDRIYDLIGNVAEWCSTTNRNRYDLRGGSWASPPTFYDPLLPNLKAPQFADATTGFRLAATALNLEAIETGSNRTASKHRHPTQKE